MAAFTSLRSSNFWFSRNLLSAVARRKTISRLALRTCSTEESDSPGDIQTEKVGHVFMVGIDRPNVRNCVNLATASRLVQAFTEFEKNDDLWVAVLYGKGGCFCAGFDLKALASLENADSDVNSVEEETLRPMGPSKMLFSKPVIAAVSGYAVAGGLELALMCDIRVVEETATMGVFCRKWGVPLIDGGTVRLQKLIGLSNALDLILTGRPVRADEALRMGLANRVCPPGSAVGEAVKLAQLLCLFPQGSLRADRRSAYYAAYDATSYEDAFAYEWENGKGLVTKEAVSGAKKFSEGQNERFSSPGPHKSKI